MFEKEFDIAYLIALNQKGEISPLDKQLLNDWLNQDLANRSLFDELINDEILKTKITKFSTIQSNVIWDKVTSRIAEVSCSIDEPRKVRLWSPISMAAVACLTILLSSLFYFINLKEKPQKDNYTADIAPGKVGATLTLANGKHINLSTVAHGKIAKELGVDIIKTENGQVVYEIQDGNGIVSNGINTLSTAKGEIYFLRLPDGSSVWLNAGTTLKFPASFSKLKTREVELDGEAFFEIIKDKTHPFIVKSAGQEVRVLGTHFNVNNYNDEHCTKTTLIEGSIQLKSGKGSPILKPGQQSLLTTKELIVQNVNTEVVTSWKDGRFHFKDTELQDVLRQLSRWYNIDIAYKDGVPDIRFTGFIDRNYTLSEALEILKYLKVNFKVVDRTIEVHK